MKKLFSILTVFIFLFAFSTSALAVGWEMLPTQVTAQESFNLKVTKVDPVPLQGYAGPYYREFTGQVIKGSRIAFIVTFTVPKDIDVELLQTFNLTVKGKNIQLDTATPTNLPTTVEPEKTYNVMYTGYVVDTGATSVSAQITMGYKFNANRFSFSTNSSDFVVEHIGNNYRVSTIGGWVDFIVDNKDKITDIDVNDIPLTYKVDGTLNLDEVNKTVLNSVFNALGFTLDGNTGYMYESAFTSRFGSPYTETSYGVYVENVIIPSDQVIDIPQTGDRSTIIGWAMLAAGLVLATTVIILKKRTVKA